jgi:RHS repeat-associated protein
VDGAGQVTLAQGSRPFGAPLWQVGSGRSGFGFTGEQVDGGTGLVFLRARYYDPLTGRFISRDPFAGYIQLSQTLNRYAYVVNRPIHFIDPSGLDWKNPTQAEGIAIHEMIESKYQMEAIANGRRVEAEVRIPFTKKQSDVTKLYWLARGFCLRRARDPEASLPFGKADILDYTLREVYEIKHYPSWAVGQADAIWYAQALNTLPKRARARRKFGPPNWRPGTSYPTSKRYIGPWPTDPKAEVWAERVGRAVGVIGYWGKKKGREPRRQPELEPVPVLDPSFQPQSDRQRQLQLAPVPVPVEVAHAAKDTAKKAWWVPLAIGVGYVAWNLKGCVFGPVGCAADLLTPGF